METVAPLQEIVREVRGRYGLDVFIEPGKALVGAGGYLVASVLDKRFWFFKIVNGVRSEKLIGPATRVIDANTEVWRFFARFTLARATQEAAGTAEKLH